MPAVEWSLHVSGLSVCLGVCTYMRACVLQWRYSPTGSLSTSSSVTEQCLLWLSSHIIWLATCHLPVPVSPIGTGITICCLARINTGIANVSVEKSTGVDQPFCRRLKTSFVDICAISEITSRHVLYVSCVSIVAVR